MQFQGSYNDPVYGGSIKVCVSSVNGDNIGQAVFSEIGYMRGVIDGNNTWTGDFWSAGYEVKQGTFILQFTSGASTTFSGTFVEKPNIVYSVVSTRYSTDVPDDMECFRSDNSYLDTSNPISFNYNGTWMANSYQYIFLDPSSQQLTATYGDTPVNNEQLVLYGVVDHNPYYLNGQITAGNFYEPGGSVGIELYVPKNATTFYITWWYLQRVADLNFTATSGDPEFHQLEIYILNNHDITWAQADAGSCYQLPTVSAENKCLGSTVTVTNTSHKLSVGQGVGIALGVIVAFAVGAAVAIKKLYKPSLSSSSSENKNNNTAANNFVI